MHKNRKMCSNELTLALMFLALFAYLRVLYVSSYDIADGLETNNIIRLKVSIIMSTTCISKNHFKKDTFLNKCWFVHHWEKIYQPVSDINFQMHRPLGPVALKIYWPQDTFYWPGT